MNLPSARHPARPRWLYLIVIWACMSLVPPDTANAAPSFVMSGRLSELDATILAADAGGPVTALETLFYLDIARHPARNIPVEAWLDGSDARSPETEVQMREALEQFLAARSLARQEGSIDLPAFLERSHLYTAAEAAWIETSIIPEIVIEDEDIQFYYIAHADRYTRQGEAQVRYIFLEIGEGASAAESSQTVSELEDLRNRILAGNLTFDTAAKLYSNAPSKERGGLIPPFAAGEYFQEFERNAFDLEKIGDISPVFLGPDGVYMVQLISERKKPVRVPLESVVDEIRAILRYQHVRPYYRDALQQLTLEIRTEDFSSLWEYINEEAPIARVGQSDLSRDQLLRINPEIVNARYDIRGSLLVGEARSWIEGELVMQKLEELGQAEHRLIQEARKIANIHVAADRNLRRRVDFTKLDTPRNALTTLRSLSPVASGIPEALVVRIALRPEVADSGDVGRRAIQQETVRRLSESVTRGYLPTRPELAEFAVTLQTAAAEDERSVDNLIESFNSQLATNPWPDVRVEIESLGWQEALQGLSRHPSVPELAPGEVSIPQKLGESETEFYYVAAVRSADSTPWLEYPLILQVAAYEVETRRLLREELARVREEQGPIALP